MGEKGKTSTANYIDFDRATIVAEKLLSDPKKRIIGLYILVSINTGLRAGDVLQLKWNQLQSGELTIEEKKTGKARKIALNDKVKKAIRKFDHSIDFVFISQKGTVFSIQQINFVLKQVFSREAKKLNISSHSLRKSFGRRVYENNHESEKALVYLSELFNHTSASVTRKYLGIRQEEIDNIYLTL